MLGLSSDPIELHTFLMKDPDLLKETNKILNRGQRSYNVSFLMLSVKLFYVLFYALQVVYLRVLLKWLRKKGLNFHMDRRRCFCIHAALPVRPQS